MGWPELTPHNIRLDEILDNYDLTDRFKHQKDSPQKPSFHVLALNITHNCNLSCAYCFRSSPDFSFNYSDLKSSMTSEVMHHAIRFFFDGVGNTKEIEIGFFGGEPLLAFDQIQDCVAFAKDLVERSNKHLTFSITTNGTILNDRILDFLSENDFKIIISIDGSKEDHDRFRKFPNGKGSYNRIIENAQKIVERCGQWNVIIRGTFLKPTIHFSKMVPPLLERGFKNISIENGVLPESNPLAITEVELDELENEYTAFAQTYLCDLLSSKPYYFFHFSHLMELIYYRNRNIRTCGAGTGYIDVTPNGDIYPCHRFVGSADYLMGNVNTGEWKPDIGERIWQTTVNTKERCKRCWARYACGGGCYVDSVQAFGIIERPIDVLCHIVKLRMLLAPWLLSTLLEKKPGVLFDIFQGKPIGDHEVPRTKEEVYLKDVGDGVLVHTTTKGEYSLNSTSRKIWDMCNGDYTVRDIVDNIHQSLEGKVSIDELKFDVLSTLLRFRFAKIIEFDKQ